MDFYQQALELQDETIEYRRYLHMHPEPGSFETETAAYISNRLAALGVEHLVLPCNAVIGYIRGATARKCVALRADIDALMTQDECDTAYRSINPGVSHVCGHDFHIASLLTAAKLLQKQKSTLNGTVKLIFQNSEERPPSGAAMLVKDYAIMDGVDAIFALHIVNTLDAGDICVQSGARMSGSMNFYVDVYGKGGHGATPNDCIDPILASCAMIMNLQSIVSREIPPGEAVSITVGKICGGTEHNSVANAVRFEAAIKSLNADLRDQIRASVHRILTATAETYRCNINVKYTEFGQPLINDAALSALAERSAAEQFGAEHVVRCPPWPVSEDFTKYLDYAPGLYAFLGGRNVGKGLSLPNHHPAFDADESALAVGAAIYAAFAYDYLNQN